MSWFREISGILQEEPEESLAFLYGQRINDLPHLTTKAPKYKGVICQLLKFVVLMIQKTRIIQAKEKCFGCRFLVYAETRNQFASLVPTVIALTEKGESVHLYVNGKIIKNRLNATDVNIRFQLVDLYRAVMLLITKGIKMHGRVKKISSKATSWHFSKFCDAYLGLSYFYRLLDQEKPECVIVANDHNVMTRCLLAVASYKGIKTAYLQHASVSPLFPPLTMDYAFLDGEAAEIVYAQCKKNSKPISYYSARTKIIHSGQKKKIEKTSNSQSRMVGIAVNSLENPEKVVSLVDFLVKAKISPTLRWHPGQPKKDIDLYYDLFERCEDVKLSDPIKESVDSFLSGLAFVVSGNSSILLEAALSGVKPIYYEITKPKTSDYYGYVKQKVALQANSISHLLTLLNDRGKKFTPSTKALQFYSSTYGTPWEGREGHLVAKTLVELLSGRELGIPRTSNPELKIH